MACIVNDDAEGDESVVFLYKLDDGALCNSCGLNVGKLAGMSPAILGRAGEVSRKFEEQLSQGKASHYAKALCSAEGAEGARALWAKLAHRREC